MKKKFELFFGMVALVACLLAGCSKEASDGSGASRNVPATEESASRHDDVCQDEDQDIDAEAADIQEDSAYTSVDEVAAYLKEFGHLPDNFITKKEARKLGWVSKEGNLEEVAPGKRIGGDHFGNYEDKLPEKKGRKYYECDIDSDGGYRGAKRIIYSNDGLIYYTQDHYNTFKLLYGEE